MKGQTERQTKRDYNFIFIDVIIYKKRERQEEGRKGMEREGNERERIRRSGKGRKEKKRKEKKRGDKEWKKK